MGKSRLALELVLAQASGWWNAGFLDPQQATPNWALWQPRLPTLMVVDYAGREAERVARMLQGLAERSAPHLLRYPVRVVLIERDNQGTWLDTIKSSSRLVAGETTRAPDLVLGPIHDTWPIFEHVLGKERANAAGREETLASLAKIDARQRPLFAFFVADAMRNGRGLRGWDRTALLAEIIQRERQNFWLPAAMRVGLGTHSTSIANEERVLVLATMVGLPSTPLTREELEQHRGPLLPTWDIDRHPVLFAAMTGSEALSSIRPLEPDIIGEFFVLDKLKHLAGDDARTLVSVAWRMRPKMVWWFVSRCAADFGDHEALAKLYSVQGASPRIAEHWARAGYNVIYHLGSSSSTIAEARRLHREMLATCSENRDEPLLRKFWAEAAVALIYYHVRAADLSEARQVFDELRHLASENPSEPELRQLMYQADDYFGPVAEQ
jgi:hypothetical protein